jgi:hypothetical protein
MPAVTSRWEMRDKRTARERTIGMPGFGVTRRLGVYLTKSFEIVHGELVAQEMQEDILEGTSGMIGCWISLKSESVPTRVCKRTISDFEERRFWLQLTHSTERIGRD